MLVIDSADRDEVAMELMRFRDGAGDGFADLIDTLTHAPRGTPPGGASIGEVEANRG